MTIRSLSISKTIVEVAVLISIAFTIAITPCLGANRQAAELTGQGNSLYLQKDLVGAIAKYEEAIAEDPNYAIAYSNMTPPLQQRLGDKKAHTLVVGKNEPVIQESRPWPWFIVALLAYLLIRAVGVVIVLYTLIE